MGKLATALQIGRTFGVRDGMLRLGYELRRGSGLLSHHLQSVQGWSSWELERIAPGTSAKDLLHARRDGSRPFFFADSRALGPALRAVVGPDGEKSILAEAQNILNGNLPYFGRLSFASGFPPYWFQNPATGQRVSPDRPWTTMRFASPDYGDLKFILEPSRFLFIYPLARAYALSGDARLAEAFWSAVEDWAEHNPPMSGPLWICGQESSLRILAWSFGLHAFIHAPATTPERMARLLSMIAAHAWRTEQTLGYARSQRSNHLVSEAVGLWTAGTLYPELKDASAWRNVGAQLLREAVLDQITPEGAYLQDSFNYQRMVLHLLLWTLRLAEIHSIQLHPDIRERTTAAFEFLRAFVDPDSGYAPNHGSNDGSLILPLALCDYGDFRPLLQLGACVLGHEAALSPGPWDEAALWLCGKTPVAVESKRSQTPPSRTGFHRLGTGNSWAMVRAGHYSRRPFQADQLHVDLWWRGLNLARDAGTYLYNGDPPWNNGLAGTAVHNTVMLDHHDQMRRAGRFLWLDWAQASGRSFSTSNAAFPDYFEGEHDGYRRFGVTHRRMVQYLADAGWVIVDDLLGSGEHDVRLHWLLPDQPLELVSNSPLQAVLTTKHARVQWNISCSSPGKAAMVKAGKSSAPDVTAADTRLLGWESPTYGELRPAVSLIYHTQARMPVRLITVVLAGEEARLQHDSDQWIVWRGNSEIYRIGLAPRTLTSK